MNAEDLLDESLGQLDPDRRAAFDREIAADPVAADVLGRLAVRVHLLLDDGLGEIEPPPNLSSRTIALIGERRGRRSILEFAPVRVPFRWADVAVAAGIFLAGLLTLLPAVQRSKARVNQASCAVNLQQLGFGLGQYSAIHGTYPYVSAGSPASRAGTFAVLLNDNGLLPSVSSLDCPGNGTHALPAHLPRFDSLCQAEAKAPKSSPCLCGMDYAYNIGHRLESGHPGPIDARVALLSTVPLLADRPNHDSEGHILKGNSPNHNGGGQNVLFSDNHVGWYTGRRISPVDDDMFLNADQRPAPGVHLKDAVLVPGTFRFDGGGH